MITINGNQTLEWQQGMTVQDVFDKMGFDYTLIVTTVNGEYIAPEDYDSHIIPDDAKLKVIHIAHGG